MCEWYCCGGRGNGRDNGAAQPLHVVPVVGGGGDGSDCIGAGGGGIDIGCGSGGRGGGGGDGVGVGWSRLLYCWC